MTAQVSDIAGQATSEGGIVLLDGLEGTALSLTPAAAEEMGRQLIRAAEIARHAELVARGEPAGNSHQQQTGNRNGEQPNDRDHQTHGTSRIDEVGGPAKKTNLLPWILAALGTLALLFTLSRCNRDDRRVEPAPVETNTAAATPDVTGTTAAAGTAAAAGAVTGNALEDMRTYLASGETAGRRFSFDNIEFTTGSADVPASAQTTIAGLGQLLGANPNARVRVEGYADARGDAAVNRDLGAQRAQAIKTARDRRRRCCRPHRDRHGRRGQSGRYQRRDRWPLR